MASIRCPGCGAPYNGRKCRACLYEPMETDISRQPHESVPVPEKKASVPRPQKQKSAGKSLRGFLILLALIVAMMPRLQNWGVKLEAIEAANMTPEPIPGDPTVLFQQDPITVLIPEEDSPCISLWFYNHGREDALVICKDVSVNGHDMDNISLTVLVPAGSAVKGTLVELETLADSFAFAMEAQTSRGEFLFETASIHIKERVADYD